MREDVAPVSGLCQHLGSKRASRPNSPQQLCLPFPPPQCPHGFPCTGSPLAPGIRQSGAERGWRRQPHCRGSTHGAVQSSAPRPGGSALSGSSSREMPRTRAEGREAAPGQDPPVPGQGERTAPGGGSLLRPHPEPAPASLPKCAFQGVRGLAWKRRPGCVGHECLA